MAHFAVNYDKLTKTQANRTITVSAGRKPSAIFDDCKSVCVLIDEFDTRYTSQTLSGDGVNLNVKQETAIFPYQVDVNAEDVRENLDYGGGK